MATRHRNMRVIIITGLAGSGKSTALRALEDIGFLCVDNLPIDLLPRLLAMRDRGAAEVFKVALVMDLREPNFIEAYPRTFRHLEESGYSLEIVFLEASNEVLIRRFSQTRRTHPSAAGGGSLREAIAAERRAMENLRETAEAVIDTSELSVHELKDRIITRFRGPTAARRLHVSLMSFGYKYGLPYEADIAMDVRFLPNPYFVDELRDKSGLDREVMDYVLQRKVSENFLKSFSQLLRNLLPLYDAEGKAYLTVAVGCTGGRHRSVATVDRLAEMMVSTGYDLTVSHRDIDRG